MPTAEYIALFGGMRLGKKDDALAMEIAAYPTEIRMGLVSSGNPEIRDDEGDLSAIAGILAGEGWTGWPGEDYISVATGLSRVELRNGLAKLVKLGLLVHSGDGGYKFSGEALLRIHKARSRRIAAAQAGMAEALAKGDVDAYNFRRIGAEIGISESEVKATIKELVRKGWLARGPGGAFVFTKKFDEFGDELLIKQQLQLDGKLRLP